MRARNTPSSAPHASNQGSNPQRKNNNNNPNAYPYQPAIPSSRQQQNGIKSPRIKSANYVEKKAKKTTGGSQKVGMDAYISTVLGKENSKLILEGRLVKAGKYD
jgi:hypothetical protein